jgi:hypothetical protein
VAAYLDDVCGVAPIKASTKSSQDRNDPIGVSMSRVMRCSPSGQKDAMRDETGERVKCRDDGAS